MMSDFDMTCLNWNIEWATASSKRGCRIKKIIESLAPDVICLTETTLDMVPDFGYCLESAENYGYSNDGSRRKVILWSNEPWHSADSIGNELLPTGRFVSGITRNIQFVGVCIPWADAHVQTGNQNRSRWQDHAQYLRGLEPLITKYHCAGFPICLIGDYNQCIPRYRQKRVVAEQLSQLLGNRLDPVTANVRDCEGKLLIDHVATSSHLDVNDIELLSKRDSDGLRLSDHVGITVRITNTTKRVFS